MLWPVDLIYKAKIAHADWVGRHPDDPPAAKKSAAIGEKLRPAMPSLFNVEVAYEIAAYEYAKSQPKGFLGWAVKGSLKSYLQFHQDDVDVGTAPDIIRLSGEEVEIVRRLCETPRYSADRQGNLTREPAITFDPKRLVYRISEALAPANTKPEDWDYYMPCPLCKTGEIQQPTFSLAEALQSIASCEE